MPLPAESLSLRKLQINKASAIRRRTLPSGTHKTPSPLLWSVRAGFRPSLEVHKLKPRRERASPIYFRRVWFSHRFRRYPVPVLKHPRQFPPHHPTPKEISQRPTRQFVLNPILQPASLRPLGNEHVCVFPTAKWSGSLHITKLPPFAVAGMLKRPTQTQRPHVDPHRPVVSITNSRGALDHLHALPWRSQPFQRSRLRVPAK